MTASLTHVDGRASLRLDEGITLRLDRRDRDVVIVSDTHLGPPPPYGFPHELEVTLAALVRDAARAGDILVLDGDILDGGTDRATASEVLSRYPRVRAAVVDACTQTDVVYVIGNHDPAATELRRAAPWKVATRLLVGDIFVTHGHELDVGLRGLAVGRLEEVLARFQRVLGTRIDLPLSTHDGLRNRLFAAALSDVLQRVDDATDDAQVRAWLDENINYLLSLETQKDPRYVLATLARTRPPPGARYVVCGHTHHPGTARVGDVTYVNCGTWSRELATATRFHGDEVRVEDVVTGRTFGHEAYDGWEEPGEWRAWLRAHADETSVGPVLQRVVDRALGGWGRAEMHGGALLRSIASLDVIPRRPAETLAQTPTHRDDAGNPLSLCFVEKMRGVLRTFADPARDREVALDLAAAWSPPFSDLRATLNGTVTIEGLAADAAARGTLTFAASGGGALAYEVAFVGEGGRAFRLSGTKTLRLADLPASFTELPATLFEGEEPVGEAELVFDARKELGHLIRSVRVEPPRPRSVARGREPMEIASHGVIVRIAPADAFRVAVTGATGHLGFNLVAQLLRRGHRVVAMVRSLRDEARVAPLRALSASHDGALELVEVEMTSPASVRRALGQGVDRLVHAASAFHLVVRDPERDVVEPTVMGTAAVLRAAHLAGVARVVLTSSIATFGTDATGRDPLDERDWNDDARHAYHRAKTLAERRAWELAEQTGLDLVVLNPASFLGPNHFRHTPSTRLVADMVARRLPAIPPFALSWVDVRDVAWAHVLALETKAARGRYAVATTHLSFEQLYAKMVEVDPAFEPPRRRVPTALARLMPAVDWARSRIYGTERTLTAELAADLAGHEIRVSSDRIRRELGWAPTDITRTVADAVAWARAQFEEPEEP